MKVVVINGTEVKGCTYNIKEMFINKLGDDKEIKEFYLPKDVPVFCNGCKACFFKGEEYCPNNTYVSMIWQEMIDCDLLLFAYPVYGLGAPAQVKALMDTS